MPSGFPILFLLSLLGCFTLFVAGVNYYLGTRENALDKRIQELQEQSGAGAAVQAMSGDIWGSILRSTYGAIFGKQWFREKELELMRAGFRGPRVVKVYGIASLGFNALL